MSLNIQKKLWKPANLYQRLLKDMEDYIERQIVVLSTRAFLWVLPCDQGKQKKIDPLSWYLFILAVEPLPDTIKKNLDIVVIKVNDNTYQLVCMQMIHFFSWMECSCLKIIVKKTKEFGMVWMRQAKRQYAKNSI